MPSRINLGKSKYGGPFTTEQVEDVKTLLRLLAISLPLFFIGVFLSFHTFQFILFNSYDSSFSRGVTVLFTHSISVHAILATLVFEFIIYPLARNKLPSITLQHDGFLLCTYRNIIVFSWLECWFIWQAPYVLTSMVLSHPIVSDNFDLFFIGFLLFCVVVRWYKLRVRDDDFSTQRVVEEVYDRYLTAAAAQTNRYGSIASK